MSRQPIHPDTDLIVYGYQFKILRTFATPGGLNVYYVTYPEMRVDDDIVHFMHKVLFRYQMPEFIDDACNEYKVKPDLFLWVFGRLGKYDHVSQVIGNNVMVRFSLHALRHSDFVWSLVVHELLHLRYDIAPPVNIGESDQTYQSHQLLLESYVNNRIPDRFAESLFAYDIFSLVPEEKIDELMNKNFKMVLTARVPAEGLLGMLLGHPKVEKGRSSVAQLKSLYRGQRSNVEAVEQVLARFQLHPNDYGNLRPKLEELLSKLSREEVGTKAEVIFRGKSFSYNHQILPMKSVPELYEPKLTIEYLGKD